MKSFLIKISTEKTLEWRNILRELEIFFHFLSLFKRLLNPSKVFETWPSEMTCHWFTSENPAKFVEYVRSVKVSNRVRYQKSKKVTVSRDRLNSPIVRLISLCNFNIRFRKLVCKLSSPHKLIYCFMWKKKKRNHK